MKFFRPATKEDFDRPKIPLDYHIEYLPKEVETLIEEKGVTYGVKKLRDITGIGMQQACGLCKTYDKYLKAKKDFENGLPVYVEY